MERGDGYISAAEAAERLGYVYKYFIEGKLKKGKVPGAYQEQHGRRRWYVPESAVESYERPTNVTPELEHEILSRYRSGEAPMDLSRKLEIPKSTIYSAIHRDEARRRAEREKPLEATIRERFHAGAHPFYIARDLGISSDAVLRAIDPRLTEEPTDNLPLNSNIEPQTVKIAAQVAGVHYTARLDHTWKVDLQAGDRVTVRYSEEDAPEEE